MNEYTPSRLAYAARWSLGHLLLSLLVAVVSALVVFGVWYPAPWRAMLGVQGIFLLIVAADVVCGPLLTLVLSSPRKSSRERWLDLSLTAMIQIAALAYGLFSVFAARPVVLVFEVDRLVVVTANEVQTELLGKAPNGLQSLSWTGVKTAGLRQPQSTDEYLNSLEQSLQGVTQPMRPNWWMPYDDQVRAAIKAKAQPLGELLARRPLSKQQLELAAKQAGYPTGGLFYLPLTSSKETSWIALIGDEGDMVGYASVDAFD